MNTGLIVYTIVLIVIVGIAAGIVYRLGYSKITTDIYKDLFV